MSDDPFAAFQDLFPGKRPPINRPDSSITPKEVGWDDKPRTYIFGTKAYEFFLISHLSDAIGKAPQTIRAWEARGILPKTPFRSPRPRNQPLEGKANKGKRLWTREQIEGIVRIAREERVILDGGPPPTPAFTHKVQALFKDIYINSEFTKREDTQR